MVGTSSSPISSQTTPLEFFSEAQLLNGVDYAARHVKHSSFTTHLSGRFYRNASISSHQKNAKRYEELRSKRKELAEHLELENEKVRFLETKLKEGREKRRKEEAQKERERGAAVRIQTVVRGGLDRGLADARRESGGRAAVWLQTIFRGRRDCNKVRGVRLRAVQRRNKEIAAVVQLQGRGRGMLVRSELNRRRKVEENERIRRRDSACRIQACERGRVHRTKIRREGIERCAVVRLQCVVRGAVGRRRAEIRRRAYRRRNKKRPPFSAKSAGSSSRGKEVQRVPLQERRYSTYRGDRRDSNSQRRSSDVLIQNESVKRRSSMTSVVLPVSGLDIVRMAHAKGSNLSKSNRRSEASLSGIDINELDSLTSTVDSQTAKLISARKRAAARSAKLQRDARREKEKMEEEAKARKEELNELGLKRRNQIKVKAETKKLSEKKKIVAIKDQSVIMDRGADTKDTTITPVKKEPQTENNVIEIGDISLTEDTNVKDNNQNIDTEEGTNPPMLSLSIPCEHLFEDNFEEDFCENEDDLE